MPRPVTNDRLTPKEQLFVTAYLACHNATEAAVTAGFSQKSAKSKGSELLHRERVAKAIEAERQRIVAKYEATAERTVTTAEKVLDEMAVIAFSDIRHFHIDGQAIDWLTLAPDAPASAARAVKKVKRQVRTIPQRGEDAAPIVVVETEVEFWNKDVELRALGEHLKMFKENRADDPPQKRPQLTPEERKARVLRLVKTAIERQRAAGAKGS